MVSGAAQLYHNTWGSCIGLEAARVTTVMEQNVKVVSSYCSFQFNSIASKFFPVCYNTPFSISALPFLSEHPALLLSFIHNILASDSTYYMKCCHGKPRVELQHCPKLKKHQHLNTNLLTSLWAHGPTLLRLLTLLNLLRAVFVTDGLRMVCDGANLTQGSVSSLDKIGPCPHVS